MKKLLYLSILISSCAYGQVNSAYLNKEQKENIFGLYKAAGVKALLETRYKEDKVSGYTIELLDSLGRTKSKFGFNDEKELTGNTIYLFDELGKLVRTERFNGKDVFMIDEYYYNIEGEEIESVQLNKQGKTNSKTISFYSSNGLKDYSEIYGPDGKITFRQSIEHSNNLPSSIKLTHIKGFVMSSDKILYNNAGLPKTKNSTMTMSGKTSKYEYNYNDDNLLIGVSEYSDGALTSNKSIQFFRDDFEQSLVELGFDYSGSATPSNIESQKSYYLKNLASFPNGEEALANYLRENTEYPKKAKKTGIHGIVIVSFAIESDGSIVDVEVRRGLHPLLDKEAMNIVKEMPNWIPAEQSNGDFYKSTASIAVQF